MDAEQELKLYSDIGELKANQDNVCERVDNLAELLVQRSEKWDKASVVSQDNKELLDKKQHHWDKASNHSGILMRAFIAVATSTIIGGIAFIFFTTPK